MMEKWIVLIVVLGYCSSYVAGQSSYMYQSGFGSNFYISPVNYTGHLQGPIGFGTGKAYWNIGQWGNPSPIPITSVKTGGAPCSLTSADWNIENTNFRICLAMSANTLELAQSGQNLACGQEYDLFVGPNTPTYNNAPVNWNNQLPALSNLRALYMNLSSSITFWVTSNRCGGPCGGSGTVDYGYLTASVTLSGPSQSLFYQIILADTRMNANCGSNPCVPYSSWFFQKNPFGISESIAVYNQPCLYPGYGTARYQLNLLPRLLNALSQGASYGMNSNPSLWKVDGMYFGLGGQGEFTQTTLVSDISVVAF